MEYPARKILLPLLPTFLDRYPHVKVDISINAQFVDIIKEGFDAGICFGSHLEKDVISIPLTPPLRAAIVGSPKYFSMRGYPKSLKDLKDHDCINFHNARHGGNFRWIFQQDSQTVELVEGGRIFVNDVPVSIQAAIAGLGLAYTFREHVTEHLATGTLEACLTPYCPDWLGYHLYYPGRQQKSPALTALIEHLSCPVYASTEETRHLNVRNL
ncbi:LysR substrate-binding domain-containing protein [Microbulbifer epialgicus]|uniref:LysR substrate-binding domain-containing protein n=1 Tax=Microbulbifer epialgicus TaxID=393907 RepID=A0ABV4P5X1_9GAMM